jgi:hypothetical protein
MATFSPTPLDHFLAVRRAHALQETMARLSLASVWLVCSFHGSGSLWFSEAGILCPIRSNVKPLIACACCAFCLIGLADRISNPLSLWFLGCRPTGLPPDSHRVVKPSVGTFHMGPTCMGGRGAPHRGQLLMVWVLLRVRANPVVSGSVSFVLNSDHYQKYVLFFK